VKDGSENGNSAPVAASSEAHRLLGPTLETLAEIERRRKDPSQDLTLAIEALAAVIDMIQADARSMEVNAAGSLKRVQAALHDVQSGAKPALIYARPDRNEDRRHPGGRPTDTTYDGLRGHLAAAVYVLIEAGVPREEAGRLVARQVAKTGILFPGIGLKGVTAKRILRWRDDVGGASSQVFNDPFNAVKNHVHALVGPQLDRSSADIVVKSVLQGAAKWFS
jgi:hypothetical protein